MSPLFGRKKKDRAAPPPRLGGPFAASPDAPFANPWSDAGIPPAAAPPVAAPAPPVAVPAPPVAVSEPPVVEPEPPAAVPESPAAVPESPAAVPEPPVVDDAGPGPVGDGDEDGDDGATVVVERRPKAHWSLDLESGERLPIAGDAVVLGRRPAPEVDGARAVAVPDPTRTLSKTHARLERVGDGWVITDLGSTNGTAVFDELGRETELARGESAPVRDRFLLGTVAVRLTHHPDGLE